MYENRRTLPSQQCPPTTITLLLTTKLTVPEHFAKVMPNLTSTDVDKFVEKFGRKWKKMENYSYFCR